jgi:hypothetical protein
MSNELMTYMLSEAWRQPENDSEGAQDPADILEKLETKLNETKENDYEKHTL